MCISLTSVGQGLKQSSALLCEETKKGRDVNSIPRWKKSSGSPKLNSSFYR